MLNIVMLAVLLSGNIIDTPEIEYGYIYNEDGTITIVEGFFAEDNVWREIDRYTGLKELDIDGENITPPSNINEAIYIYGTIRIYYDEGQEELVDKIRLHFINMKSDVDLVLNQPDNPATPGHVWYTSSDYLTAADEVSSRLTEHFSIPNYSRKEMLWVPIGDAHIIINISEGK